MIKKILKFFSLDDTEIYMYHLDITPYQVRKKLREAIGENKGAFGSGFRIRTKKNGGMRLVHHSSGQRNSWEWTRPLHMRIESMDYGTQVTAQFIMPKSMVGQTFFFALLIVLLAIGIPVNAIWKILIFFILLISIPLDNAGKRYIAVGDEAIIKKLVRETFTPYTTQPNSFEEETRENP